MKKKIIALLLTIVMCTMSLWGCGSSTYFTELKDFATSGDNIAECTFEMQTKGNVLSSSTPFDYAGGSNIGIKTKAQSDEDGNFAVDIDIRMKDVTTYDKLTTVVKEGKNLYFTTKDILAFVDKYQLDPKGQLKAGFAQIGVKDWCKLDIEQLCALTDTKYDEDMFNMSKHKDDISDYVDEVVEILDNDFNNLTSKDGDNFVLKVDKNNISTAIDDLQKFLDKDIQTVYEKTYDLAKKLFGEELTQRFPKYKEKTGEINLFKDKIKRDKADIIKSFKTKSASIESEVNSDKKTFTFNMKGEKASDMVNINMDVKTKEGEVNIKKLVPSGALDLTAVLKSLQSSPTGSTNYNNSNSTATY